MVSRLVNTNDKNCLVFSLLFNVVKYNRIEHDSVLFLLNIVSNSKPYNMTHCSPLTFFQTVELFIHINWFLKEYKHVPKMKMV